MTAKSGRFRTKKKKQKSSGGALNSGEGGTFAWAYQFDTDFTYWWCFAVIFTWLSWRYQLYLVSCTGIYFWGIGLALATGIRLNRLSKLVVPDEGNEQDSRSKTQLLIDYFFGRLQVPKQLPEGVNDSFKRVGMGILPSNQVIVLMQDREVREVLGPGLVRLSRGGKEIHYVDLRSQRRLQRVEASTSDGAKLETGLEVEFRVIGKGDPDNAIPYPYDKEAIRRLSYASTVEENEKIIPWDDQIAPHLCSALARTISGYAKKDLQDNSIAGRQRVKEIEQKLAQHFKEELSLLFHYKHPEECPVKMTHLRVFPFEFYKNEDTFSRSGWESDSLLAPGNLAVVDPVGAELTTDLLDEIEPVWRANPGRLAVETVARLVDLVQELVEHPGIRSHIPAYLLKMWEKVSDLIIEPPHGRGEDFV